MPNTLRFNSAKQIAKANELEKKIKKLCSEIDKLAVKGNKILQEVKQVKGTALKAKLAECTGKEAELQRLKQLLAEAKDPKDTPPVGRTPNEEEMDIPEGHRYGGSEMNREAWFMPETWNCTRPGCEHVAADEEAWKTHVISHGYRKGKCPKVKISVFLAVCPVEGCCYTNRDGMAKKHLLSTHEGDQVIAYPWLDSVFRQEEWGLFIEVDGTRKIRARTIYE